MFEKIKEILIENLGVDEELITENASLSEDLGADSLAAVELIMALEDEFGISIPENDAKDIKTVGDMMKLVDSLS